MLQDLAVRGVVVDDQDAQPLQVGASWFDRAAAAERRPEARTEPEGAPLAGLAVDANLATHQLDQPFGDRQPEPGPTIPAGRRAVGLRERLEQAGPAFS